MIHKESEKKNYAQFEKQSFSLETKTNIRDKQNYRCAHCNTYDENLPVHHIVPINLGGSNNEVNGVGLCNSFGNRCHTVYDQLVKEDGICYGNKFLSEMPEENFARNINPFKNKDYYFVSEKVESVNQIMNIKKIYNILTYKQKITRQESVV